MNPLPEGLRDKIYLIEELSDKLFHELHGPKSDGPHGEVERVLLDINQLAVDCLNGDDEPVRDQFPELREASRLVLYFTTNADREGFISAAQAALPGLRARKL